MSLGFFLLEFLSSSHSLDLSPVDSNRLIPYYIGLKHNCQQGQFSYWCLQQLRSASRLGRVRVLVREFACDVRAVWRYGSPFPTFLKLIGSLILCLLGVIPLIYPVFVLGVTYFTFESLLLSLWLDQPSLFTPCAIARRAVTAAFRPCSNTDIWKVREVLTRGILLTHSLATSIDYLCVMQGLIDEA